MTSNLRQIKLFFLIVALVSLVCLLYAYNWNTNFYKISSGEIAQVKFTRIRQSNTATRNTYNALPEQHLITDNTMTIRFNNTVLNVEKREVTSRGSTKHSENNINSNSSSSVDSTNAVRTEEIITKRTDNKVMDSDGEAKLTTKHTDPTIHDEDSTNENKTTKITAAKVKELDRNDKNTVEHTIRKHTENDNGSKVNDVSRANNENSNEPIMNKTNRKLNTTAGDNTFFSKEFQNSDKQPSDSKASTATHSGGIGVVKTHLDVTIKDVKADVANITLNAESIASVREDLQKVKDRWKLKKETNHVTVDTQLVSDDKSKPTRDTKAFERVKAHLKQIGYSGNKLNPFALSPHLIPLSGTGIGIGDSADVTSRPDICKSCFKNNFAKLINEPKLCEGKVDLLILITSTAINTDNRDAIRKTWGKICVDKHANTKCVFVFGNKNKYYENNILKEESKKYHDITQFDFYDVYANLTYKTLSAIQWSHDFCPQAKYVMKTDDDMYVNSDLLPHLLKGAPDSNFIGGMCWGPSSPHRDMNSKWYVSFVQYKHSLFPSMCSGTGYVMSRDVADGILRQSPNVPFFYLEDVYVAICVNKLNVKPLLLAGFKNVMVDFDACVFRNRYITVHGFSGAALETCWKQVHMCPLDDLTPSMVYSGIVV